MIFNGINQSKQQAKDQVKPVYLKKGLFAQKQKIDTIKYRPAKLYL
jgi:hypothetical protein